MDYTLHFTDMKLDWGGLWGTTTVSWSCTVYRASARCTTCCNVGTRGVSEMWLSLRVGRSYDGRELPRVLDTRTMDCVLHEKPYRGF